MGMYRKDLTDADGVTVRDKDSGANIKGAAAAMHDPDNGVYGACLRGKPGWLRPYVGAYNHRLWLSWKHC